MPIIRTKGVRPLTDGLSVEFLEGLADFEWLTEQGLLEKGSVIFTGFLAHEGTDHILHEAKCEADIIGEDFTFGVQDLKGVTHFCSCWLYGTQANGSAFAAEVYKDSYTFYNDKSSWATDLKSVRLQVEAVSSLSDYESDASCWIDEMVVKYGEDHWVQTMRSNLIDASNAFEQHWNQLFADPDFIGSALLNQLSLDFSPPEGDRGNYENRILEALETATLNVLKPLLAGEEVVLVSAHNNPHLLQPIRYYDYDCCFKLTAIAPEAALAVMPSIMAQSSFMSMHNLEDGDDYLILPQRPSDEILEIMNTLLLGTSVTSDHQALKRAYELAMAV